MPLQSSFNAQKIIIIFHHFYTNLKTFNEPRTGVISNCEKMSEIWAPCGRYFDMQKSVVKWAGGANNNTFLRKFF